MVPRKSGECVKDLTIPYYRGRKSVVRIITTHEPLDSTACNEAYREESAALLEERARFRTRNRG